MLVEELEKLAKSEVTARKAAMKSQERGGGRESSEKNKGGTVREGARTGH